MSDSSAFRWVLLAALVALLIPIPRFGMPVSVENAIYAAGIILLLSAPALRWQTGAQRIAIAVMAFALAQFLVKWVSYGDGVAQVALLRRGLLVIIAAHAITTFKDLELAAKAVLFGAMCNAVLGILNVLDFGPAVNVLLWIARARGADATEAVETAELASERAVGFGGTIFGFSYFAAPALLVAMGLLLEVVLNRRRRFGLVFVLVAAMLTLGLALVFNAERSAVLALLMGIAWFAHAAPKRAKRLVIGMGAVLGVVVLGSAAYEEALLHLQGDEKNILAHRATAAVSGEASARVGFWRAGIVTVLKHPLSGGTWDDYQTTARDIEAIRQFLSTRADVPAAHNAYVNAGLRAGVLGWVLLIMIAVPVAKAVRTVRRACVVGLEGSCLAAGVTAGLLTVALNAMFHNAGVFSGEPMTWTLIALTCAAAGLVQREMPPPNWQGASRKVRCPVRGNPMPKLSPQNHGSAAN